MLKISKENFWRNIANRASWDWHAVKSNSQSAWRKNRSHSMTKYDAWKGLPQPVPEESDYESDDPYHRKVDVPKGPRSPDHFSEDKKMGRYLAKM